MSCKAKKILVSEDGISYYVIPGSDGGLSQEGETIEDTVLGQCFKSSEVGLKNWSIDSGAIYKGFPGYKANVLKAGTPIVSADEPMTAITVGSIYRVTDTTKRVITENYTLKDGTTDITDEIDKIDLLDGTVYLKSSYSVNGAITMDIEYMTLTSIGKSKGYDITQSSNTIDTTDFDTSHGNEGSRTFVSGLKEADMSIDGIYDAATGFTDLLNSRELLIVEITINEGTNESYMRGYYKLTSVEFSGSVGDLEEASTGYVLNVPFVEPKLLSPFKWYHPAGSTIPEAVKLIITAWENNTSLFVKYQPFGDDIGETSYDGKIVVSDTSLSADLDSMNEFSLSLQGTDQLTTTVIA